MQSGLDLLEDASFLKLPDIAFDLSKIYCDLFFGVIGDVILSPKRGEELPNGSYVHCRRNKEANCLLSVIYSITDQHIVGCIVLDRSIINSRQSRNLRLAKGVAPKEIVIVEGDVVRRHNLLLGETQCDQLSKTIAIPFV